MDLQEVLFKETFHALTRWRELKKELGEWDNLVNLQHAKFCALYTVIENAGLEEMYQLWKELNNLSDKRRDSE